MKRRAFTLIELLVVLAIVSLLTALIFPVFARAREKARGTTCLSNLRQLGLAVFQYADDEDSRFPYCGDASDIDTDYWQFAHGGKYWPQIQQMQAANQFLPVVLNPYVKSPQLWQCPSDTGFDETDDGTPLPTHPSSFTAFGSSYYYRTVLALDGHTLSGLAGYDRAPPHAQHGPEAVNVLFDGSGAWHGGAEYVSKRYNTLFGDGHAANLTQTAFRHAWGVTLDAP